MFHETTTLSNAYETICGAIRMDALDEAEQALATMSDCDAIRLNLLGVICEKRRQWRAAARYYGKAIRADHYYRPAQENMRRMYELNALGHSTQRIMLGDERPALAALLRARDEQLHGYVRE